MRVWLEGRSGSTTACRSRGRRTRRPTRRRRGAASRRSPSAAWKSPASTPSANTAATSSCSTRCASPTASNRPTTRCCISGLWRIRPRSSCAPAWPAAPRRLRPDEKPPSCAIVGTTRWPTKFFEVSPSHVIVIGLAGFAAGAINALVGSGTLITFPTLVALGYPPVTSTMSNAVGLVAGSVSGTWGYRAELGGQWDRLRWQIPASLAGGVLGSFLLLHLPEKVFIEIVPVLLVLALVLVVMGPRIQSWARRRAEEAGRSAEHMTPARMTALVVGTFAVGVYGGYFTAAQGILLIGVMGALLPEDMQRMNAAKNLLSLLVNIVAAVGYTLVASDRISWSVAAIIAVSSLVGGLVGARYG